MLRPIKGSYLSFSLSFLLFRERVCSSKNEISDQNGDFENSSLASVAQTRERSPSSALTTENVHNRPNCSTRCLTKSASISASKCVSVNDGTHSEVRVLVSKQTKVCSCLFIEKGDLWLT